MSDQEVDLNALIQSDKRRQYVQRQKRREQYRQERQQRSRDRRRDYQRRDRSPDDRRRKPQRQNRRDRNQNRRQHYQKQKNSVVLQTYAISAKGFVSDVSLDDILKLAKGKQIINIKAFLDRQDGQPLQQGNDTAMSVIINFVQKKQADQFIKEYADKKLDGKNPLQFQFRRGIVMRKPKRIIKQENQKNQKQGQAKSEEQVQSSNKN